MVDVLVVGGGHNGLVAAAYLARAGFDVLVAERNDEVGGAVASGEITLPGHTHDLFATNVNPFLASVVFDELGPDLARHGLEASHTSRPFCSVFPGGRALCVYQDRARTRRAIAAWSTADAEGWGRFEQAFDRHSSTLFGLYGTAIPSLDAAQLLLETIATLGTAGLAELARLTLSSTRELGEEYFTTPEVRSLVAAWGMHLDFGPDVAAGAVISLIEVFSGVVNGMAVVKGGAARLPRALVSLVREAGGEVRTGEPVRRISVAHGRASSVELGSGEVIGVRRGVVANVTPRVLLGLIADSEVPARDGLVRYRYGPATMMVHLALEGAIPWEAGEELARFGYVHVGPYLDDMARSYTDAENGELPTAPLLIVGQTSAIDVTRAPEGRSTIWIQVRTVPSRIRSDAAGEITDVDWERAKPRMADRVLACLESYAPGLSSRILGRAVLGPDDLERHNPNLAGGDSLGGSHHLLQSTLLRPLPGWSRYRTPVDDLWMVGSATWPGAGVNAVSGRIVAEMISKPRGWGRRIGRAARTVHLASRVAWMAARASPRMGP